MGNRFDCVVCGLLCVDLAVRPIDRGRPLRELGTQPIGPIRPGGGGIVANSGIALAKLGLRTAAFACVGDDLWADVLRRLLGDAGVDTSHVQALPGDTSVTAILVGADGEHNFAYHSGASEQLDGAMLLENLSLFEQSKFALFGYYGLTPQLEAALPAVLPRIREAGCRTALDASAGGGTMQPLDRILPHLDLYVPSLEEAVSQTGERDPRAILSAFREYAPEALLGVKLGEEGALLSPASNEWIDVPPVSPPGPVVDTTGAGDCFYAGLIAGLSAGLGVAEAGRLGAAAGACSVTGVGAVSALRSFKATRDLAR